MPGRLVSAHCSTWTPWASGSDWGSRRQRVRGTKPGRGTYSPMGGLGPVGVPSSLTAAPSPVSSDLELTASLCLSFQVLLHPSLGSYPVKEQVSSNCLDNIDTKFIPKLSEETLINSISDLKSILAIFFLLIMTTLIWTYLTLKKLL